MDEDLKKGKELAKQYYDQESSQYKDMYGGKWDKYPANLIRLNFLVKRFKEVGVKSVLDCGCGTCVPIIRLAKEGFEVRGFDFAEKMVEEGRRELVDAGLDPNIITNGDIEDEAGFPEGKYDALIALGVFPHLLNEPKALANMKKHLNPGGRVFIEFRNDLFAAYTLNRYSLEFYLNRVVKIDTIPEEHRQEVIDYYAERLGVEKPKQREDNKIAYDDILAKFRNPLTLIPELFEPLGFKDCKFHFYHFHALPPVFEKTHPKLFRELSLKMEKTDDWRGFLVCSAFVIEARIE